MDGKEALQNIGIEFDNMAMICSNIGYEEFYAKDLHFNEIFKTEIDIINQELDKLESLKRFKTRLLKDTNKLYKENEELKNTIKELSEKIAKDSAKMSSMNSELRKLKGGFIPQNFKEE